MNEPLFLRREQRSRTGRIELDTRDSFGNGFPLLLKNERERVYDAMRESSKGRIYFDDIEDLIQQVKLQLKDK